MSWTEARTAGSIPERFQQIAQSRPDAIAVAGVGAPITYGELSSHALAHARRLPKATPTPPANGGVAALLLDHGRDALVGALAALFRGFAVISLNPSEPASRHAALRDLVEPSVLLTDARHMARAREAGFAAATTVLLDPADLEADGAGSPDPFPGPDELAFLISTSGSSGQPKIVMQSHRNMLHNVLRYANGLGIEPEDRIAWLAALSGGQGLATAWTALLNGATLCPFPITDRGVTGLKGWLEEQSVTVLDTVPSVLRNFSLTLRTERISGIRLMRLASEPALGSDFEAFRRHFPEDCRLATVLGSSETGITAQAILDRSLIPGERLPVGFEAEGVTLRLETEDRQAASAGEPGEIVITSRYLSPGYWRDEELTARRFEGAGAERRFRTGDVARRTEDGMLVIIGRRDSQVKVRGHRLQLEEVESAIAAQAGVAAVAVAAGSTARGDTRLTAYVATTPDSEVSGSSLRAALRGILPPHAVPAAIELVEALPLNAHGKVDRTRLSELDPAAGGPPVSAQPPARRPVSETEELVASIWRQAFDRDDIGVDEPFLELGGDSLTAAVIAAGVEEAFGLELGLSAFAAEITIAKLALLVEDGGAAGGVDGGLPPLRRHGEPPASYAQRVMWHASHVHPAGLILATAYRIRGPLDVEALRRSIERIVARHETLRTRFARPGQLVVQLIDPPQPLELPLFDFRDDFSPDRRARDLLAVEARRSFDLEQGPLLRFCLARLGEEEYELLRVNHHLIADGPSWQIFLDELATAYEAELDGAPHPLEEEPPLQYADFAMWERAIMQMPRRPAYQAEIAWWVQQVADPARPWAPRFQRPQPLAEDPGTPRMLEWGLEPARGEVLDQLGRDGGATYYMTRLAVFSALLGLENRADDVLLESFFSTRRHAELQRMIGLFINRTLLRLRFRADVGFRQWLADVRRTVIDTSAHSSIPQMQLRDELLERGVELPASRLRFAALYQPAQMRFGGLTVDPMPREQLMPRGFALAVDRNYDATGCRAVFDPRVYDPALVGPFIDRLQAFVAEICARPDAPLAELHAPLLTLR